MPERPHSLQITVVILAYNYIYIHLRQTDHPVLPRTLFLVQKKVDWCYLWYNAALYRRRPHSLQVTVGGLILTYNYIYIFVYAKMTTRSTPCTLILVRKKVSAV